MISTAAASITLATLDDVEGLRLDVVEGRPGAVRAVFTVYPFEDDSTYGARLSAAALDVLGAVYDRLVGALGAEDSRRRRAAAVRALVRAVDRAGLSEVGRGVDVSVSVDEVASYLVVSVEAARRLVDHHSPPPPRRCRLSSGFRVRVYVGPRGGLVAYDGARRVKGRRALAAGSEWANCYAPRSAWLRPGARLVAVLRHGGEPLRLSEPVEVREVRGGYAYLSNGGGVALDDAARVVFEGETVEEVASAAGIR